MFGALRAAIRSRSFRDVRENKQDFLFFASSERKPQECFAKSEVKGRRVERAKILGVFHATEVRTHSKSQGFDLEKIQKNRRLNDDFPKNRH